MMDQKTVNKLEKEILNAIFPVIAHMGLRRLPLLPSHQTVQMMAKAAVAVYEAVVESDRRISEHKPGDPTHGDKKHEQENG